MFESLQRNVSETLIYESDINLQVFKFN